MALFTLKPYEPMGSGIPYTYYKAIQGTGVVTKTANVSGRTVNASKISKSSTSALINVYDSFDWSTTPYGNAGFDKNLIPRATINEFRMKNDSILQAISYFATTTLQSGDAVVETGLEKLAGIVPQNQLDILKNTFKGLFKSTENKLSFEDSANLTKNNWMKPYEGLYSLEPTPFKYVMPYFDNKGMPDIAASYSDMSYPTVLGDIISNQANISQGAANAARIIAPGQYVERPKIFDISTSGNPSVTITFPLLNIQSYESAVQNYQLLWLLVFQNTPQRVSKTIVELPKIYEVNVPGVTHLKFSYMEDMKIEFIGNRRQVEVQMPEVGGGLNTQVRVIMPDAYQVKMTFRSLTINSANLMLENWHQSNL